jgi:hypothetical protein
MFYATAGATLWGIYDGAIPPPEGSTNYLSVAGSWFDGASLFNVAPYNQYTGIFYNRNKITLGQLSAWDGSSNTMMFGEALIDNSSPRVFKASWMISPGMTTWGVSDGTHPGKVQWYAPYASRHAGGITQFCFGDCSVRGLRPGDSSQFFTPAWYVVQALAGKNDGDNRDTSALTE